MNEGLHRFSMLAGNDVAREGMVQLNEPYA